MWLAIKKLIDNAGDADQLMADIMGIVKEWRGVTRQLCPKCKKIRPRKQQTRMKRNKTNKYKNCRKLSAFKR